MSTVSVNVFLLMIRRPPRSTLTSTLLPTRRSSDLIGRPPLPLRARHLYGKAASYRWAPASMARPIPFPALSDACLSNECHRSEEHTSELQSLMRISYAVFCLKKKKPNQHKTQHNKPRKQTKKLKQQNM